LHVKKLYNLLLHWIMYANEFCTQLERHKKTRKCYADTIKDTMQISILSDRYFLFF
jgi:hypothetical protein